MLSIKRNVVRAYIYSPDQKRLLIIKSPIANIFSLPGGAIGSGESTEQALERELHEELGIEKSHIKQITFLESTHSKKRLLLVPFQSFISYFSVVLSSDPKLSPNWEIRKFRWVTKEQSKTLLKKYLEQPF